MTSGSRFHILHSDTAVIGQEYELCEFIIIFSLPALLPCCITKNTTACSIRLSQNAKVLKCCAPEAFSGAKFQVLMENSNKKWVGKG